MNDHAPLPGRGLSTALLSYVIQHSPRALRPKGLFCVQGHPSLRTHPTSPRGS